MNDSAVATATSFGRALERGAWADPALGATLVAPREAVAPFPVAVLVHGSGPNDRDERVGANRPFRDLALGLGARGVAVLRYDKRTYVQARVLAGRRVTRDVETVDDALAALAGRPDAAVELRRALNHLLVPGEGPSSPEEYQARPGHVEPALVERLAAWMLAQPARPARAKHPASG